MGKFLSFHQRNVLATDSASSSSLRLSKSVSVVVSDLTETTFFLLLFSLSLGVVSDRSSSATDSGSEKIQER